MNSEIQVKKNIENNLKNFDDQPIRDAATNLLDILGYRSKRISNDALDNEKYNNLFESALETSDPSKKLCLEKWQSYSRIMQITDEEINQQQTSDQQFLFESTNINENLRTSYMFAAVELDGSAFTRTQLADITRFISKDVPYSIMVMFRYSDYLSLAIINRRHHKRDKTKQVLEKVTLIKDINLNKPNRAHIEILYDLYLRNLIQTKEVKNFDMLHDEWEKILNTEELNKQFYRKLFAWYEWVVEDTENVKFPTDEKRVIKREEHVIRLITRLLFIWFIKEKGLVAEELFTKAQIEDHLNEDDFDNGDSYYRVVLQNLFFATLNTEISERKFSKENNNEHRNFSRYRYKKQMHDPNKLLKLFAKTPFINGGLFDCLDSEEATRDGGYRIDCFSDKQHHKLSIPNRFFFDEKRGLLILLAHYKFTVEENTPIDQEVALDPELLGRVFENLLAAINPETGESARKMTGSYYTPRAIVDYMVEEALIATITQKCNPNHNNEIPWKERLRYLFDYAKMCDDASEWFDYNEINAIVRTISELKILDPAVGSGAFPMGVLHKLTLALKRLDPKNNRWEALQKELASKRAAEAFNTKDQQERDDELTEISDTFERYRDSDFGRKLYLIQNSIFGVDIQPIACQIAKLRFFISLAIEQEKDENAHNFGIKPLPNLETRFVAANTLIGFKTQRSLASEEAVNLEHKLRDNREQHFHATTRKKKRVCKKRDEKLRTKLAAELKEHGAFADEADRIAEWDPYDQNDTAEWFDSEWMFGIVDGYDVVIGNPPYVDSENMTKTNSEMRKLIAKMYVTTKGNWDLYIPFWEISLKLIHEKGIATLITPNKWLSIGYGKALRQYSKSFVYKFVDYSRFRVFESAGVFPVVVFMSQRQPNSIYVERYSNNHNIISNQILLGNITNKFENWGVFLSENLDLVVNIMEKCKRLLEYCDAEEPFTVSEAYKLSEYLCEYSSSGHDVFKFINTGSIDPYVSLWGTKKTTYLKQKYDNPVVKKESLRKHFEKRYIQTTSPKIIISGIRYFEAFLDIKGEWIAGKSTVILRNFRRIPVKLIIGILNSRIVTFFLNECYSSLAMDGGINFSPSNVSEIPIPDFQKSKSKCNDIIEKVTQIIAAKVVNPNENTTDLENQIDKLVYTLYDLTPEEIAIVEGADIGD